jgi:hypothetical protein
MQFAISAKHQCVSRRDQELEADDLKLDRIREAQLLAEG